MNVDTEKVVLNSKIIQDFLIYNGLSLMDFERKYKTGRGEISKIISGKKESCRIELLYKLHLATKLPLIDLLKIEKK